ncbi:putative Ras-related protein Rab-4A [Diplonema papillatum]|nr:putative Ras-related protein Rab-4A [Diplonema papillatum]
MPKRKYFWQRGRSRSRAASSAPASDQRQDLRNSSFDGSQVSSESQAWTKVSDMTDTLQDRVLKIVVLGDRSSGKSAIIDRYCLGLYNVKYVPTIGPELSVTYVNKERVAGTERFEFPIKVQLVELPMPEAVDSDEKPIRKYLSDADGVVVVADVTQRLSLEVVDHLLLKARKNARAGAALALLFHKVDRRGRNVLPKSPAADVSFASMAGLAHVGHTTALDTRSVCASLDAVISTILSDASTSPPGADQLPWFIGRSSKATPWHVMNRHDDWKREAIRTRKHAAAAMDCERRKALSRFVAHDSDPSSDTDACSDSTHANSAFPYGVRRHRLHAHRRLSKVSTKLDSPSHRSSHTPPSPASRRASTSSTSSLPGSNPFHRRGSRDGVSAVVSRPASNTSTRARHRPPTLITQAAAQGGHAAEGAAGTPMEKSTHSAEGTVGSNGTPMEKTVPMGVQPPAPHSEPNSPSSTNDESQASLAVTVRCTSGMSLAPTVASLPGSPSAAHASAPKPAKGNNPEPRRFPERPSAFADRFAAKPDDPGRAKGGDAPPQPSGGDDAADGGGGLRISQVAGGSNLSSKATEGNEERHPGEEEEPRPLYTTRLVEVALDAGRITEARVQRVAEHVVSFFKTHSQALGNYKTPLVVRASSQRSSHAPAAAPPALPHAAARAEVATLLEAELETACNGLTAALKTLQRDLRRTAAAAAAAASTHAAKRRGASGISVVRDHFNAAPGPEAHPPPAGPSASGATPRQRDEFVAIVSYFYSLLLPKWQSLAYELTVEAVVAQSRGAAKLKGIPSLMASQQAIAQVAPPPIFGAYVASAAARLAGDPRGSFGASKSASLLGLVDPLPLTASSDAQPGSPMPQADRRFLKLLTGVKPELRSLKEHLTRAHQAKEKAKQHRRVPSASNTPLDAHLGA